MKQAGLSHIEWGSDVHAPLDKVEEIAELQKKYGVKCCSYGTYFKIGTTPVSELEGYARAAKILGTDILRVWCGNKNSGEYSNDEKTEFFSECKRAAQIARECGVTLCMECHMGSFTDTKESAYKLMREIDSDNFKIYWQPRQDRSVEENLQYARLLAPYTVNIHVFNWKGKQKLPLEQASEEWKVYLGAFEDVSALLLEFMPDGRIETLKNEVRALKEIVG